MATIPQHVAQQFLGLCFREAGNLLGVLAVVEIAEDQLPGPVEAAATGRRRPGEPLSICCECARILRRGQVQPI